MRAGSDPLYLTVQRTDAVLPRMTLTVAEFQDLAEHVSKLTTTLAGCDVQLEVAVSYKPKPGANVEEGNKVLGEVKDGWKL